MVTTHSHLMQEVKGESCPQGGLVQWPKVQPNKLKVNHSSAAESQSLWHPHPVHLWWSSAQRMTSVHADGK